MGIFDYEIAPLDEYQQRSLILYVFIIGFGMLGLMGVHHLISILPPDTRSEYQKAYDSCIAEEHINYIVIEVYYHSNMCSALLDAFLMNGSKIISTIDDEDGDINAYLVERLR